MTTTEKDTVLQALASGDESKIWAALDAIVLNQIKNNYGGKQND